MARITTLNSKARKFKRFLNKFIKLLLLVGSIISGFKLAEFISEQRIENAKNKRRQNIIIAAIIIFGGIIILCSAAYIMISYIKSKRSGYFFDFFDRDSYDIIDADEEEQCNNIIRGELSRSEDSDALEKLNVGYIPLDDEETEDSFK